MKKVWKRVILAVGIVIAFLILRAAIVAMF